MQQTPTPKKQPKPEKGERVNIAINDTLIIQGKVVETVGSWVLVEYGPRDIVTWLNGKPAGLG